MIIEWKQKENIMVWRWFDNSVLILSTYIGLFPLEEAKRWDRKKKDYTCTYKGLNATCYC